MKALTICQPYAHLIVRGEKLVENRDWPTRHRGQLAIHAGKSREWLGERDETFYRNIALDPLVFGAIVGQATIVDCLHIDAIRDGTHDMKYPWLREHRHTLGVWCWVLQNVIRFERPISWRGAQGLWDIPDEKILDVTGA